jgi:TPR repeat protein
MVSLAELYEGGRGVESNRAAALKLYQRALGAGHSDAALAVRRIQADLRRPEYAAEAPGR